MSNTNTNSATSTTPVGTRGYVLYDGDGVIVYADPAFAEIVGVPLSDLSGMHAFDLTHPEDRGFSLHHKSLLDQDLQDAASVTKRFVRPSGETVWVKATAHRQDIGLDTRIYPCEIELLWVVGADATPNERMLFGLLAEKRAEREALGECMAHLRRKMMRLAGNFKTFTEIADAILQESMTDEDIDLPRLLRRLGMVLASVGETSQAIIDDLACESDFELRPPSQTAL